MFQRYENKAAANSIQFQSGSTTQGSDQVTLNGHKLAGGATTATTASNKAGGKNAGSKAPSTGANASVKTSDQERRKGIPWTEAEHRLFLLGLAKFGKGDWRSISRNFVVSRTPTQVASHAQKYFIRLNSMNKKDKRRSSIHDITSVNGAGNGNAPAAGNANQRNTNDMNSLPQHPPGYYVQNGYMQTPGMMPGYAQGHM